MAPETIAEVMGRLDDISERVNRISVFQTDKAIKDDLIIGRPAILEILKLSHWDYMGPYLKADRCPIKQIGKRWVARRSLLDVWLNDILEGRIQVESL